MLTQSLLLKPVLKEAWMKVKGAKKAFFFTFLGMGVLQLLAFSLQSGFSGLLAEHAWIQLLTDLIIIFLCTPFLAGFAMLGVQRARGEDIRPRQGFLYFNKILPLFLTQLLTMITTWVSLLVLSFMGILLLRAASNIHDFVFLLSALIMGLILIVILLSLSALFSFALILVADQNKNPLAAYLGSFKTALPHLKILLLAQIVFVVFTLIGAMLVGIGLLWAIPFSYIVTGLFYQTLFRQKN